MSETNNTYVQAADVIKTAILQGQYEAVKGVNRYQLATYFGVGKYVSLNTRNGYWRDGALKAICERLHCVLPGLRGYNVSQMKNMRTFYEAWNVLDTKSPFANGDTLKNVNSSNGTNDISQEDKSPIAIGDTLNSVNSLVATNEMEKIDIFTEMQLL